MTVPGSRRSHLSVLCGGSQSRAKRWEQSGGGEQSVCSHRAGLPFYSLSLAARRRRHLSLLREVSESSSFLLIVYFKRCVFHLCKYEVMIAFGICCDVCVQHSFSEQHIVDNAPPPTHPPFYLFLKSILPPVRDGRWQAVRSILMCQQSVSTPSCRGLRLAPERQRATRKWRFINFLCKKE